VEVTTVRLTWDESHNVASIAIVDADLSGRARDAWRVSDDVVFDLDGAGRVINIQVLDPARMLEGVTTAEEALSRVLGSLATLRAS
jgi:uncharacterized protein YuzE